MKIAPPWVYITFTLAGTRAEGVGQTMYGAEFDTDKDGRENYLIWGASPAKTDWTTDGVEVWKDTNYDVGGPEPGIGNAPWLTGNGYDQNLFSSGQGADADLAWIRQLGGEKVQLAFKYTAIGSAPQFLWNGVADVGVKRPEWYEYNDHFTQAEAGSPLTAQTSLYPLKKLFGLDNTCRDAYGFTPAGTEKGLCQYYGTISGVVAWDLDHSDTLDPIELSTTSIGGDTVTLGQGACPSSGFKTAVTDSNGKFSFPDLLIGKYCVGLIHTVPNPIPVNPVTVQLAPGENKMVYLPVRW
jgi:hypothetical protein